MSALVRTEKCYKCGKELKIKTFVLFKGKKVAGKGYICEECLKKQKDEDNNEEDEDNEEGKKEETATDTEDEGKAGD